MHYAASSLRLDLPLSRSQGATLRFLSDGPKGQVGATEWKLQLVLNRVGRFPLGSFIQLNLKKFSLSKLHMNPWLIAFRGWKIDNSVLIEMTFNQQLKVKQPSNAKSSPKKIQEMEWFDLKLVKNRGGESIFLDHLHPRKHSRRFLTGHEPRVTLCVSTAAAVAAASACWMLSIF